MPVFLLEFLDLRYFRCIRSQPYPKSQVSPLVILSISPRSVLSAVTAPAATPLSPPPDSVPSVGVKVSPAITAAHQSQSGLPGPGGELSCQPSHPSRQSISAHCSPIFHLIKLAHTSQMEGDQNIEQLMDCQIIPPLMMNPFSRNIQTTEEIH